ncbi:hypothetical protein EJ069_00500 [Mesorhizobium sp. M2A.F.Ca.ET.043.05.1.1]|uniref:hypothetical protein n=1 Tax=Mesorhizobium sp. M2A.F.Ca.ET.043.05.1.1 TaxID=2493671 RepID=UPI000F756D01|nr:hypothetical protein [Mesorhizobium sp. M2A.F.Ca.ET.043.05.1.1]AZO13307.1 hypothetical protein EJ069_00500 [Mesorhizobium sp. M2A.F.Ca.ET.043.05.1.1]TIV85891.1 MAG: hypothetical protein E5V93_05140 [Mesorhizobium sp.]TIW16616.1 MAG: hypothetical protein E5V81_22025 [Mesorhizobium sp.]
MNDSFAPYFSRSDTMVSVPKAVIELSAIKLEYDGNASLRLPKGRKPINELMTGTLEAGGPSDIKSTGTPGSYFLDGGSRDAETFRPVE